MDGMTHKLKLHYDSDLCQKLLNNITKMQALQKGIGVATLMSDRVLLKGEIFNHTMVNPLYNITVLKFVN